MRRNLLIRDLGIPQARGERSRSVSYTVDGYGMRAHLPAINAAIGRAQLARFPVIEARRKALWSVYQDALDGIAGLAVVDVDVGRSVPFNCVVRLLAGRDRVFRDLRDRGIGVGIHYPPNHLQPAFATWRRPLPRTELLARQVMSLPFHPALTGGDIGRVVALLKNSLRRAPARYPSAASWLSAWATTAAHRWPRPRWRGTTTEAGSPANT